MNAREFFKAFLETLEARRDDCVRDYRNSVAFTKTISSVIEDSLKTEDVKSAGVSREYYRIDVTSWKGRSGELKEMAPHGFRPYLWDLEVAVEHENSDEHWMDEVVKLAHVNCPLRVVIGYVPAGKEHGEYTDYASLALRVLRCEQKPDNEYLLILGNSKPATEEDYFHYQPYLFDGNTFKLQADWLA